MNIVHRIKIVIIAGVFFPEPSPTGKCVLQYANILKENYDVSVVFIQSGLEKINGVSEQGLILYALFNLRLYLENYFIAKAKKKDHSIIQKFFQLMVLFIKAVGRIQSNILWPNNLRWFYKKAYKKLLELHQKTQIDCIFTINSPFTAHLAGRKFKSNFPNVRWMTYTVDPFSSVIKEHSNFLFPKLRGKIDLREERNIYQQADINFVSEEVYATDQAIFAEVIDKIIPLPYMLIEIPTTKKEYFSSENINLLYAGRFYRSIRNPEYFFRAFLEIENPKIILHLYATSDCEQLIEKYIRLSKDRIIRYDPVGIEEIQKIMTKADILISIGNSSAAFKPSKTFEYISAGKPIIHFYQNGNRDDILDQYPLSLQIDQNEPDIIKSANLLQIFCIKNKCKSIAWNEISSIYSKHSRISIQKLLFQGVENNFVHK